MKIIIERVDKTENNSPENKENMNINIKLAFLSNAISDISSYIHLADTKVSIIMAISVGLIGSICASHKIIYNALTMIMPNTLLGDLVFILIITLFISLITCFCSGLLTICAHYSKIKYDSKWFIKKGIEEYSLEQYKAEFKDMSDADIIDNMATELYILNDINRQKTKTLKWVLRSFAATLICVAVLFFIFVIVML